MATTLNEGDQQIQFKIGTGLSVQDMPRFVYPWLPVGVYAGFDCVVVDSDTVELGVGHLVIEDSNDEMRIKMRTRDEVQVDTNPTAPWIVARWIHQPVEDNYVLFTETDSPNPDDVVLGKGVFDNSGNLIDCDESDRTLPWGPKGFLPPGFEAGHIKVTVNDAVSDYLLNKLAEGAGINLKEIDDGGDEQVLVSSDAGSGGDGVFQGQRELEFIPSQDQTNFQISGFDPLLDKEDVFLNGNRQSKGTSNSYERFDEMATVSGSTGNDGTYTVRKPVSTYDSNADETDVYVSSSIPDSTADGTLDIDGNTFSIVGVNQASNIFTVSGDALSVMDDTEIQFAEPLDNTDEVIVQIFQIDPDVGDSKTVKVSDQDNTAAFLAQKLAEGIGITIEKTNVGGDEDLRIKSDVRVEDYKPSVRAVTDGKNIDLGTTVDPGTIDGVSLNVDDRVLLKDQIDSSENGIYIAKDPTDPQTWERTDEANDDVEITAGMIIPVEEGDFFADSLFMLVSNDPLISDSDALEFVLIKKAGNRDGVTGATYYDAPVLIQDGAGTGTFDVSNITGINDRSKALLVRGIASHSGSSSGASDNKVKVKKPSHTNYKDVAVADVDDDAEYINSTWYGLEDGQLEFDVVENEVPSKRLQLDILGESV